MKKLVVAIPGNEILAEKLAAFHRAPRASCEFRHFPDGESYVRLQSDPADASVYIVCTLHRPDALIMPLYLLARLLRERHALRITLVAPYLAYLRQDKEFKEGEAVSARYFAELLSGFVDEVITVDPHLHRISELGDVFKVPVTTLHSMHYLAAWIKANVSQPFILGPDGESRQWVQSLARLCGAPFAVLSKVRHGDNDVEISSTDTPLSSGMVPVLVDDIISTAGTMRMVVKMLLEQGMRAPVCLAVHAVFSAGAYEELRGAGPAQIVTCNTIPHFTNRIDISPLLCKT